MHTGQWQRWLSAHRVHRQSIDGGVRSLYREPCPHRRERRAGHSVTRNGSTVCRPVKSGYVLALPWKLPYSVMVLQDSDNRYEISQALRWVSC